MADALPKFIDGLSYSGLSLRRGDILTAMHDGTALGVRAGVRPGGNGLRVTLAGSTITVAAGIAELQYQSGQGAYRACLAASTNLTLAAANATLSRIDLVYLRVWDNAVDASGLNQADAVYLAGTAASSPVAPVPTGTQIYIPLATITVPPVGGGSASVSTSVMPFTVGPGGILPSATAPASPYTGQFYDNGTDLLRYNGSGWDTYQKVPGAWTPYTPTITNMTLGNGTVVARYQRNGTRILTTWVVNWGSTSSGNLPAVAPPVLPASLGGMRWTGSALINRGTGKFRAGVTWLYDSSTTITTGALTTSVPPEVDATTSGAGITMTAGGWIIGSIEYETA